MSLRAVIFDLDGVITKTASVHAKSWKQTFDEYLRLREKRGDALFREFTNEDYLKYVDGKPRYEGVKSFLESRSIHLSFGTPEDKKEDETVCGLGNKKNDVFLEVIHKEGAEIYDSTIQLIKALKKEGVHIGVASSSKSCQLILQSVGFEDLFETRVDGQVSVELGLKGKPEGDIFVQAARNLGVEPADAVVVEDAVSGVQAGRNGCFGLVIGVARKDNAASLIENGADIAVPDLSSVSVAWIVDWFKRCPRSLLESWDCPRDVSALVKKDIVLNPCYSESAASVFLGSRKPVFFFDYDGTLTPIVARPDLAVLSEGMRQLIEQASKKYTVAIVSGRMREDVEKLVGIKGLCYAGSHGFDIKGPAFSMIHPQAQALVGVIDEIIKRLKKDLSGIEGILIEEKKFSTAVHYRLVQEHEVARIEEVVVFVANQYKELRLMRGKKVFEILPGFDWNKGKAIQWIMRSLKISWNEHRVLYFGDDTTDEDAFRAVCCRGTGILVADAPKISAAIFQIFSVEGVKKLLEKVIK
ncbi:MAG: trehalose-phosphatase [Candidatus Omnitrophota bacterium]